MYVCGCNVTARPPTKANRVRASFFPRRGHSAGISRLRWAMGQSHLISVGIEDRCVMQWRHDRDDLAAKEAER